VKLPRVRGGWRCLVADPPWRFSDRNTIGAAERHYETMCISDIANMPVKQVSAPDAVLSLWCPDTHLEPALFVAKSWGFTYRHLIAWGKVGKNGKIQIGLGHYFRKSHEVALLCTRGRPEILDHGVSSLILAQRHKHSQKPDQLYSKLERLCPGPRLELFARQKRKGWKGWGLEYPLPGKLVESAVVNHKERRSNGQTRARQ
jgi:N6-adenosine-specific RNA methylase IME4